MVIYKLVLKFYFLLLLIGYFTNYKITLLDIACLITAIGYILLSAIEQKKEV